MAKFVKLESGTMINVEQITAIYPNKKLDKYVVDMANEDVYYVTHDEFIKITGKQQCQASDKKYAIKVFFGDYPTYFLDKYLALNRKTGAPVISTSGDDSGWQAHFTKNEIEELKKRDDIAIDWDKVELEEVDDD